MNKEFEQQEHLHPLMHIRNLNYTFPGATESVLQDISFDIHEGETIGVVGESGSGKTALLLALSGIIPSFYKGGSLDGDILFQEHRICEMDLFSHMQNVKMIFQDPSTQYLGAGVKDVLAFGMENLNMPREIMQDRMQEIAGQLHISHLLHKNTQSLSGGEMQATGIASVLVMDPKLILMDEVISALDPEGQQRIKSILMMLKKKKTTMIVVDSDVHWLESISDRLFVLQNGRLIFDGNPRGVFVDSHLSESCGTETITTIAPREFKKSTSLVEIQNVSFSYDGGVNVLTDVDVEINSGSCTAFVGHNGSGKTTLAKIIAGLKKPKNGSVLINGIHPENLSARELIQKVGYIFQNPAQMFVANSVKEELAYAPSQIGKAPKELFNGFKLRELRDKSPWELSAGQQQQLAIASTLSVDPEIIIFDEPTFGQTRRDREHLVETIKHLQSEGKTVIVISHDMKFVRQAAEYVYEFDHGRIKKKGAAKEYFSEK